MLKRKQNADSRGRKPSVGAELVKRLEKFTSELSKVSRLSDRFTCRTVGLPPAPTAYTPQLVKQTRAILKASQTIFARFLGVSVSAVRDWEQGLKQPRGSACRLMDEIRRDPAYWKRRLRETARLTPAV